jgi:hypothetical protein
MAALNMYVKARKLGMAGRRGMGALNCPGDPGCPGYVAPVSPDYTYGSPMTSPTTVYLPSAPFSFTDWLNQNSTVVAIGGVAILALMFMRGGGR